MMRVVDPNSLAVNGKKEKKEKQSTFLSLQISNSKDSVRLHYDTYAIASGIIISGIVVLENGRSLIQESFTSGLQEVFK